MTLPPTNPEPLPEEPVSLDAKVPLGRAVGMGPFPSAKTLPCGCVLNSEAPDSVAQIVRFWIDFSRCTARHVPVPTHCLTPRP